MKDCRECRNSVLAYSKLMCDVQNIRKPVEYMRDERGDCGREAILFDPKAERKYAEFE